MSQYIVLVQNWDGTRCMDASFIVEAETVEKLRELIVENILSIGDGIMYDNLADGVNWDYDLDEEYPVKVYKIDEKISLPNIMRECAERIEEDNKKNDEYMEKELEKRERAELERLLAKYVDEEYENEG